MTELEKAKAYDEVREKIALRFGSNVVEEIFSEFEESEDERIRKAIIDFVNEYGDKFFSTLAKGNAIAWLEKQKDTNVLIQEASEKAYTEGMRVERKHWLEKQCKKKSIDDLTAQEAMDIAVEKCFEVDKKDPCEECSCAMLNCTHFPCDKKKEFDGEKVAMATMDMEGEGKKYCKVKPKFKVGDFILNGDVTTDGKPEIFKIRNVCSDWYDVENIYDGRIDIITFKQDWSCRLWNIGDAKDGDVLAEDSCMFIIERMKPNGTATVHCCLFDDGDFDLGSTLGFDADSIYPATKEQRDLLFSKMKEAGYEWDADKKELKLLISNGGDF